MPLEDSARIGIHNENRMLAGVEQDGIGSFRTNAVNSKELFAQDGGWSSKHLAERAVMLRSQKTDKLFQLAGLLSKVARRADQASELAQRNLFHGADGQQPFFSQGP